MEKNKQSPADVKDVNREQIQEWLVNDLKRLQSLAAMLQDPILLPKVVDHIEGLMINDMNRKRVLAEKEVHNG